MGFKVQICFSYSALVQVLSNLKNNMQSRNILILIFTLIAVELNAQSNFRPGYVILNNSDTIVGKIDYRGERIMCKTCRFKPLDSDSVTMYTPNELIEYRFINGKRYISRSLESGTTVFLEYLINGKLNVYYYCDNKGYDYYFIDKQGLPLKEIPYEEGFRIREDGTRVFYQSTNHIGILQAYTNDAEDYNKKSLNIVTPNHNNLIKFAEDYHNVVCKDENCIIYEKDMPFLKASIELFYGQAFFNNSIDISKSSEYGSFIYLWLPRANEKLYFKTGIVYTQIKDEEIKYFLKVPTQITYQYSAFKLRPNICFGINHYLIKGADLLYVWAISAGIGINYKFSDYVSVLGGFDADLSPLAVSIEDGFRIVSYAFHFGIRIDF